MGALPPDPGYRLARRVVPRCLEEIAATETDRLTDMP